MTNVKAGFTHDNVNNQTVDWYTPKWIFDKMGLEFDLDPCAPQGGGIMDTGNKTLRLA